MYQMMPGRRFKATCPDGRVRTFVATDEPDTYFSIPGYVRAKGVDVRGSITTDKAGGWLFHANLYHKNCWVFPEQFLMPGTVVETWVGDTLYKRERVCHWTWWDRGTYMGGPKWMLVMATEYLWEGAYGELATRDLSDTSEMADPVQLMREARDQTRVKLSRPWPLPCAGGIGPDYYGG